MYRTAPVVVRVKFSDNNIHFFHPPNILGNYGGLQESKE